jgi:hypothetical protein
MTKFLPAKIADHPTIADTLTGYLDTASLTLKPSTVAVYRGYIKNHIMPFFNNMSISELTPQTLQDFIRTENRNGLSPIVVQSVFSFLKTGLCISSLCDNIVLQKQPRDEVDYLTLTEQKRLEKAAK